MKETSVPVLMILFFAFSAGLMFTPTATARNLYVATNASPQAPYDTWGNAFNNLQSALDYAEYGDTLHLAGHTFAAIPVSEIHPDNSVFLLKQATNLIIRGGYQADPELPTGDHPGPQDPDSWPTTLSRTSGNARILTMIGAANITVENLGIKNGYPLGLDVSAYGGGVYLGNATGIVFSSVSISDNQIPARPDAQGGGLFLSSSQATLTHCLVSANKVLHSLHAYQTIGRGGGIYVDGTSELALIRSIITGNETSGHWNRSSYGGGLFVAANGTVTIQESVFAANRSVGHADVRHYPTPIQGFGGAMAVYGHAALHNSLVVSNTSNTGHSDGIYTESGSLNVLNCTLADNGGVGIFRASGGISVRNSIVWGHSRLDLWGFPENAQGTLTNVWFSNIGGGQNAGRQGCHSIDPLFVDRVFYHLQSTAGNYSGGYFSGGSWENATANSPLIDRGDPSAAYALEPEPKGERLNLGAYGNTTVAAKTPDTGSADPPQISNPGALEWGRHTVILRGDITQTGGETPEAGFLWWEENSDLTNTVWLGVATGAYQHVVNDLAADTLYVYRALASNSKGTNVSETLYFRTHPEASDLFVATNGNNTAGTNWSTAYTDLQTALEIAGNGDTIHLAGHSFSGRPAWECNPQAGSSHAWLFGLMNSRFKTVYTLQNATNITIIGGYAATSDTPLPGERDPANHPTRISRSSGVARVLTLFNTSDIRIQDATIHAGNLNDTDSSGYGAGIYFENSLSAVLSNCNIVSNQIIARPNLQGAGLYLKASSVSLTNCVVAANQSARSRHSYAAVSRGGGIYVDGTSSLTAIRSHIERNKIEGHWNNHCYGAGLYIDAGGSSEVRESVLMGNQANRTDGINHHGVGGGIANYGTLKLRNALVISNLSNSAHSDGIFAGGGSAGIINCTLADNNAYGIRYSAGSIAVSNSIIWGHSTFDLRDLPASGGILPGVWHSCIQDGQNAGEQGCVATDPLFADRITYHLQSSEGHYTGGYFDGGSWTTAISNSPVIDRGSPAADYAREPEPNGERINMGAYGNTEVASRTPQIEVGTPVVSNQGSQEWGHRSVRLRGEIVDTGNEIPDVWFVYWIDGAAETNQVSVGLQSGAFERRIENLSPGATYHFVVRATNSAGTEDSLPGRFATHPVGSDLYVSNNGDNTAGTNWSTAYPLFQTALDIAGPGDTLHVAGQTFSGAPGFEMNEVWVWRNATNIVIQGAYAAAGDHAVPGARDVSQWPTVLTRTSGSGRIMTLSAISNAVLDGIVFRNGYPYYPDHSGYGAGVYLRRCQDIQFNHCEFSQNHAVSRPLAHGGGLFLSNSIVRISDSVIASNTLTRSRYSYQTTARGGAVYVDGSSALTLTGSLIAGNRVEGHWGHSSYGSGLFVASGGILDINRCSLLGNRAERTGGQSYWGEGYGGAIASYGLTSLANSLVSTNWAQTASDGIYTADGFTHILNTTLARNHDVGVRRAASGFLTITNSIIWDHTTDLMDLEQDGEGILLHVGYSCFATPATMDGINGCLSEDPGFADLDSGDFRLISQSPCINRGINQPWMFGALDLAGEPRRQGGIVDMGCHESAAMTGSLFLFK